MQGACLGAPECEDTQGGLHRDEAPVVGQVHGLPIDGLDLGPQLPCSLCALPPPLLSPLLAPPIRPRYCALYLQSAQSLITCLSQNNACVTSCFTVHQGHPACLCQDSREPST